MSWNGYLVGSNMHVIDASDPYHHDLTERCYCGVQWKAVWDDEDGIVWQFVHQVVGYTDHI